MKDIPLFTTDFGVASLILKEIPYKFVAYIRVLNAQPGMIQNLMEECAAFCRAAGADCAFAADSAELEIYPADSAKLLPELGKGVKHFVYKE